MQNINKICSITIINAVNFALFNVSKMGFSFTIFFALSILFLERILSLDREGILNLDCKKLLESRIEDQGPRKSKSQYLHSVCDTASSLSYDRFPLTYIVVTHETVKSSLFLLQL